MPGGPCVGDYGEPSLSGLATDQVLSRLDGISKQLSSLAHGQRALDGSVRKLQQDLGGLGLVGTHLPHTPTSPPFRDYPMPGLRRERPDWPGSRVPTPINPLANHSPMGEAPAASLWDFAPAMGRAVAAAVGCGCPLAGSPEAKAPHSALVMGRVRSETPSEDFTLVGPPGAKEPLAPPRPPLPPPPPPPQGEQLRSPRGAARRSVGESYDKRPNVGGRPRAHPGEQADDLDMMSEQGEAMGWWPRKELTEMRASALQRLTMSAPQLNKSNTNVTSATGGYRLKPMHPDSWRRAILDCTSILILLYDSVLIPYQLAWYIPFVGWMAFMSWATWTFWFLDFLSGFCTGYHRKDRAVMEFHKIARRYLLTFFLPNLLVLVADLVANIVEMTTEGQSQYSSYIKLSRFIKLNRVLRLSPLLRTGKVAQLTDLVVTKMRQMGLAEQFNFMTRVCKLVFYIIWVNHVGGCVWHAIGNSASQTWYRENAPEDHGLYFQYMLSFYWSASSMIAGESIMVPTNVSEMVMTTLFVVFGFIFSSVIISSLLTTVMEYQDSNKERADKLKTLRQFLYQHNVDSAVSVPIQKQVSDRIGSLKRLSEKDVSALSLLSPVMRCELWYSIYGPSIADSAFIRTCDMLQEGFIKDICYHALEHEAHEPGERIFEPTLEALGAHFVYWGALEYLPISQPKQSSRSATRNLISGSTEMMLGSDSLAAGRSDNSLEEGSMPVAQPVDRGNWICPMALWVHWLHRGWLEACCPCELLTVKADPFVKLLASHPDMREITKDYSHAVTESLRRELPGELDDIHCSINHESLLSAIPLASRIEMSWAAMKLLERREWLGRVFQQDGYQELASEIETGECDLVVESNETVYRLVSIAALRLEREDGFVLTQIGKCIKGQTMVSCTLPGTKMQVGEHSADAVRRLLKKKLRPFSEKVILNGRTVDTQEKVSKKYGVSSRYMRTLFSAILDSSSLDGTVALSRRRNSVRSDLSNWNLSEHDVTKNYEAFAFEHEMLASSTMFIYSWLSPQDCSVLTSPGGDTHVQKWVSELRVEQLEESCVNNSSRQDTLTGPTTL